MKMPKASRAPMRLVLGRSTCCGPHPSPRQHSPLTTAPPGLHLLRILHRLYTVPHQSVLPQCTKDLLTIRRSMTLDEDDMYPKVFLIVWVVVSVGLSRDKPAGSRGFLPHLTPSGFATTSGDCMIQTCIWRLPMILFRMP